MKEPPLLVIYDGHLTHVLLKLIEKAIKVKITIVKLSPHVTKKISHQVLGLLQFFLLIVKRTHETVLIKDC